jgi:hypothetical protein
MTNETAGSLRSKLAYLLTPFEVEEFDAALVAERKATVERIRAELGSVGAMEGTAELVQRVLDAEAAR